MIGEIETAVEVPDRERAESNDGFFTDRRNRAEPAMRFREETRTAETPEQPDDSGFQEKPTARLPWRRLSGEWLRPLQTPAVASIADDFQQQVLRVHFLEPILDALRKIQPHVGSPSSITYVNSLLRAIRQMMEHSPDDPFLEVLLGFYDALTFDSNWTRYAADQYAEAYKVLKQLSSQQRIQTDAVERAVMKLEDIGFDTTPYPLDIVEKEE